MSDINKWIWTEEDFDRMGWHDCHIHAIAFSPETSELLLDLDYILEWMQPESQGESFKFLTAAATLVFENVYDLEFDIASYFSGLEIDRIGREEPVEPRNAKYIQKQTEWKWTIECQEGEITLRSVGFRQYVRTAPQSGEQKLALSDRGGYCFTRGRTDAPA